MFYTILYSLSFLYLFNIFLFLYRRLNYNDTIIENSFKYAALKECLNKKNDQKNLIFGKELRLEYKELISSGEKVYVNIADLRRISFPLNVEDVRLFIIFIITNFFYCFVF